MSVQSEFSHMPSLPEAEAVRRRYWDGDCDYNTASNKLANLGWDWESAVEFLSD